MKVCIVHKGQGGQADCQQNGPPLAETPQNLQKNEYLLLPYNFTIPSPLTSTSTFITPAPPSQPHSALYPLSSSSLPHCFFSPNSSLPPLVLSPSAYQPGVHISLLTPPFILVLGWHLLWSLFPYGLFPKIHYLYVSFSTTDLHKWKNQKPLSVLTWFLNFSNWFYSFNDLPMWDDSQQILHTLFTPEEMEQILTKAAEVLPGIASVANDQRVKATDHALLRQKAIFLGSRCETGPRWIIFSFPECPEHLSVIQSYRPKGPGKSRQLSQPLLLSQSLTCIERYRKWMGLQERTGQSY